MGSCHHVTQTDRESVHHGAHGTEAGLAQLSSDPWLQSSHRQDCAPNQRMPAWWNARFGSQRPVLSISARYAWRRRAASASECSNTPSGIRPRRLLQ
jgi:hypothetical protein